MHSKATEFTATHPLNQLDHTNFHPQKDLETRYREFFLSEMLPVFMEDNHFSIQKLLPEVLPN